MQMRIRAKAGFTLVELMVVIAIFAILTALAVPSFQQTIRAARVDADIQTYINTIQYARGEAIKRGTTVSISAPGGWMSGMTVFVDDNQDLQISPGEQTLMIISDLPKEVTVQSNSVFTNGLMFNALGVPQQNPNGGTANNGHLAFVAKDSKYWANLCLGATGRTRIYKPKSPAASDPGC